jgi:uncharacterized protein YjbI with pentapeptide repeats
VDFFALLKQFLIHSRELRMEEPPNYQPPLSVEELLQRYASGDRYFAKCELPDGANLSGVNLQGSSLDQA